jgi:uncharacterized membrane protein YphA (DoxX/SURF4 family)
LGLLLLRAVVGATFVSQGIAYLAGWHDLRTAAWVVCIAEVLSGLLLLVGYITPFAGSTAALSCVCTALSWFPPPSPNFFDTRVSTVLATTIAVAIVNLGPGAFSIDARLFGRREINIPEAPSWPQR